MPQLLQRHKFCMNNRSNSSDVPHRFPVSILVSDCPSEY
jgi:hypothetical protein